MNYFTFDFKLFFALIFGGWLISRVWRAIKGGKPYFWREAMLWLLFFYIAFLLYQTFEPFAIMPSKLGNHINLEPFEGIKRMINVALDLKHPRTFLIVFINIVGNVLIFSPIGFAIPLLSKKFNNLWSVIILGFLLSLGIEFSQNLFVNRVFDVDDLFLNTLGSLIGYFFYFLISRKKSIKEFFEDIRQTERAGGTAYALLFLAFAILSAIVVYQIGYHQFLQIVQ